MKTTEAGVTDRLATSAARPVSNGSVTVPAPRRCLVCEEPAQGRSAYCSDTHRVKAFRLRHRQELDFQLDALQADLRRRHRLAAHTVYVCDDCDERYLGEQRCEGCNRFCRAAGLGGRCPGCDEPVLIADLLGDAHEVPL
jgi:hypothetical protein